jgi:hypothetical protein
MTQKACSAREIVKQLVWSIRYYAGRHWDMVKKPEERKPKGAADPRASLLLEQQSELIKLYEKHIETLENELKECRTVNPTAAARQREWEQAQIEDIRKTVVENMDVIIGLFDTTRTGQQ